MITAIAQLGEASKNLEGFRDLEVLVDNSKAKHVLVIKTDIKKDAEYKGLELEENKGEGKYLYRRDLAGAPGLFLTGRLPITYVQRLQRGLRVLDDRNASREDKGEARRFMSDFGRKKVEGLTRGRGLKRIKEADKVLC